MFPAAHRRASLSAITLGLREHGVLVALILVYGLFASGISRAYGLSYPLLPNLLAAYFVTLLVPLALAFCWHALWVMMRIRPDRLTVYLFSELKRFAAPRRLLRLAPILLLIPVFAVSFSFLKTAIPVLNPYAWDGIFTHWDYLLHGSNHPWQLMQPWLGYPMATGGSIFCITCGIS